MQCTVDLAHRNRSAWSGHHRTDQLFGHHSMFTAEKVVCINYNFYFYLNSDTEPVIKFKLGRNT